MSSSTEDQIKGKLHEAKGAVKEKVGEADAGINIAKLLQGEKLGGTVEKKIGEVKKVFGA